MQHMKFKREKEMASTSLNYGGETLTHLLFWDYI